MHPPILYASNDNLKKDPPPAYAQDNWIARAELIGTCGWSQFQFLFFDPYGYLHGVAGGRFYKGAPPLYGHDSWISRSVCIGTEGWGQFKFLFFHPDGELYAATKSGEFYKGWPPNKGNDSWMGRATKIGTCGWNAFQFLFFDPHGVLHGVISGKFLKATPPEFPHDNWTARSTCVGTVGWDEFRHLFFDPSGLLYGASNDGKLLVATPPAYGSDNWTARAQLKGTAGWSAFQFLFFDSRKEVKESKILPGTPEHNWFKTTFDILIRSGYQLANAFQQFSQAVQTTRTGFLVWQNFGIPTVTSYTSALTYFRDSLVNVIRTNPPAAIMNDIRRLLRDTVDIHNYRIRDNNRHRPIPHPNPVPRGSPGSPEERWHTHNYIVNHWDALSRYMLQAVVGVGAVAAGTAISFAVGPEGELLVPEIYEGILALVPK